MGRGKRKKEEEVKVKKRSPHTMFRERNRCTGGGGGMQAINTRLTHVFISIGWLAVARSNSTCNRHC